ncbi:MAG: (Fe-S) protein [Hydrogenophilales bacterium]|nr:(Fe-S) protein [Hydrogenophilales bacterium]
MNGGSEKPEPGRRPLLHAVETTYADCSACVHRHSLLASGRCEPGDVCLVAHSGRQIDRFLRRNPEYAESCLTDAFWERRAIASRYAPIEAILDMVRDSDEVVRRAVALRLPPASLAPLRLDPDREVRITVAGRLPIELLGPMLHDADYLVRQRVAERLPHGQLARMAHDPEREVRKVVARRLPPFALARMVGDEAPEVRRIVASRLLPGDAASLLHDPDWLVRLEVARRAPVEAIAELVDDPEADVRSRVRARLEGFLLEDES